MAVAIRPAVASDAAACVDLRGRTRENAVPAARLAAIGVTASSWAADVDDGTLAGVVAERDGVLVGYCFGAPATGEIVVLAVLPDAEARGLGRRLLDAVVDGLARAGHRRLFLGCSSDPSCRAHGFYRHLGWRSTGRADERGDDVLEYALT